MDLATKYRPQTLRDVIGQKDIVDSVRSSVKAGERVYLFSGPSGVGKTTIARIVCHLIAQNKCDLTEIDAASHTGIDDWREIRKTLRLKPMRGQMTGIIVDECHGLSRNAWDSLLKDVEQPPEHVVWCFCTTALTKVPKAIQTRAAMYELALLDYDELRTLLVQVTKAENHKFSDEIIEEIVNGAEGSARALLKGLSKCWDLTSAKAVRSVMATAAHSEEAVALCRALIKGASMRELIKLIKLIDKPDPENLRCVIQGYFSSVAMNARDDATLERALAILDAFRNPYYTTPKTMGPFLCDLATLLKE